MITETPPLPSSPPLSTLPSSTPPPPFNPSFLYPSPYQPFLPLSPLQPLSSSTPLLSTLPPPFQPSLPSHFNCPFIFHPAVSYLSRFSSSQAWGQWGKPKPWNIHIKSISLILKSVQQRKNIRAEKLKVYCWTNITSFIFVVYCHICF